MTQPPTPSATQEQDGSSLPEAVAAIDLGSNSFHMVVAQPRGGGLVIVDRLREMVQLGTGLERQKRLKDEVQQRALACLRRFGERLRHMSPHTVRAVGTNTLRVARNAPEFLSAAAEALGHPIETISGREEARLIYLGVSQSGPHSDQRRLVIDIGGGSTELIIGEGFEPLLRESLYIGCINVSRTYFKRGEITQARWKQAELAALQELEPKRATYHAMGWEQVMGASGTIRTAGEIIRLAGWAKRGITLKSLKRLRDALIKAKHVDRLKLDGLAINRRAVFPGGVAVLLAAFRTLEIDELQPADGALREGLLYDLLGRIRAEDVRSRTVVGLANRYHVDWDQVRRVEATALTLFDQVEAAWQLERRWARPMLAWAAQLHEIGLDVAHQHYHKHGQYIIAESDLAGFSRDDQRQLALLVRANRRKFPTAEFKAAGLPRARELELLAVLLRIARLLHRSRHSDPLPDVRLEATGKRQMRMSFPEGWLEQNPLSRADLQQEHDYLEGAGLAFELA